ncbi:unnamed protein product [Caenorhabditis brenneri]
MTIRTALAQIGKENEASTKTYTDPTTGFDKVKIFPVKPTSLKNAEKTTKSIKRSAASGAPSTSEPKKKARKEIELIITPPNDSPQLQFGERGYYPVKDEQILENRYELQKMLGYGSYGTVHLAKDLHTDESVALKIVRTGELYNIASDREIGFMNTVKYTSRTTPNCVGSNNTVTLLDDFNLWGPHGLHVVMVMELLGPDLHSILHESSQKVLTVHRIKSFSKNILEGLHFLHSKCKVMHLDLKPDNLCATVDSDNMDLSDPNCSSRLKIGDFGNSARTNDVIKRNVQTHQYGAPESLLKVQITQAADIWSVGCIIYEMATRELLFPTNDEKMCDHRLKKWISPEELMSAHPMKKDEAEELNGLLKELLAIDPKKRLSAEAAMNNQYFSDDCPD